MADDRLDGSAAPHLTANRGGDPADLAGDPDPEPVRVIVAAAPLSTWMRLVSTPVSSSRPATNCAEGVSVAGISVQPLGVED